MCAIYASNPDQSRGRLFDEGGAAHRSAFQRDRDRIIHSSGFRRLKHKTQVFVEHEGDYFRTRLTHSIEVGQVARTISGALGLNIDLTEAVALAHDLGHTPFGQQDRRLRCALFTQVTLTKVGDGCSMRGARPTVRRSSVIATGSSIPAVFAG